PVPVLCPVMLRLHIRSPSGSVSCKPVVQDFMEVTHARLLSGEIGIFIALRVHSGLHPLGKFHVLIDDLASQFGNTASVVEFTMFALFDLSKRFGASHD